MNLEQYLVKNGLSIKEFAKEVGVAHTTIYRHVNKQHTSLKVLQKISQFTKGEVTIEEMAKNSIGETIRLEDKCKRKLPKKPK